MADDKKNIQPSTSCVVITKDTCFGHPRLVNTGIKIEYCINTWVRNEYDEPKTIKEMKDFLRWCPDYQTDEIVRKALHDSIAFRTAHPEMFEDVGDNYVESDGADFSQMLN